MAETGTLSVSGPFETTDVRVFDASLREVAAGTHAVTKELPPGIYRVVARVPGSQDEKLVAVEPGKTTSAGNFTLSWDSITPHERTRSHLKAQTDPAVRISKATHANLGGNARLLIYIRTRGGPGHALPSFRVLNGAGRVCASFPGTGEYKIEEGWIGCSLRLPAGTYQLEHDVPGLGPRAQAFFVDDRWQTQAFIPWRETPDFASAVLHMRPSAEGFRPKQFWEFTRTEAALEGLAHGRVVLQSGEIDDFLYGKFNDPMLGLIGAYALLLQSPVDYEKLGIVAKNLRRLIPHSPDARLLELLATAKGQVPPAKPAAGWPDFAEPPLFAAGVDRLFNLAAHVPELCRVESWLGRVSMSMSTGSTWTRWNPSLDAPAALIRLKNEINARIRDSQRYLDSLVDTVAQTVSGLTLGVLKKQSIAPVISQLLKQAAPPVVHWLEEAKVIDIPQMNTSVAAKLSVTLAPELQLPQSVVTAALTNLLNEALTTTLKPAAQIAASPGIVASVPAPASAARKARRKKTPARAPHPKRAAKKTASRPAARSRVSVRRVKPIRKKKKAAARASKPMAGKKKRSMKTTAKRRQPAKRRKA